MRDPVDPEGKSSQRHVQIRWLLDWMIMILYVMYIYIYDNMYCIGYLVIELDLLDHILFQLI